MHICLIAPCAPPKNSPEAFQVGRFLATLDPSVRVTLVTTPIVAGWEWEDDSVAIARPGVQVIEAALPLHRYTQRVLGSYRFRFLHQPDADFWLPQLASRVVKRLNGQPDVIYSRSSPFSAALLARQLKRRLQRPWLMHLSDPWAGSPYRPLPPRQAAADLALEAACFNEADHITLTTEGQADYYRARYSNRAGAISVTSNMMPLSTGEQRYLREDGLLHLVYTGALYGAREPSTLIGGIRLLLERAPDLAARFRINFYGNMSNEFAAVIDATPFCCRHGPVPFRKAMQAQVEADILLSIEAGGHHPLLDHFMPSKILDYVSSRKPILAITPSSSETAKLCGSAHGWVVSPGDTNQLAETLGTIARKGTGTPPALPPDFPYSAKNVSEEILGNLRRLELNVAVTYR